MYKMRHTTHTVGKLCKGGCTDTQANFDCDIVCIREYVMTGVNLKNREEEKEEKTDWAIILHAFFVCFVDS